MALNLGNQFNNTYYIPLGEGPSADDWDDHYEETLDNLLARDPVPTDNVKGEFGGLDNKKYAAYHQSKRRVLANTLTTRRLGPRPTGKPEGSYEDVPMPGDIKSRSPHPQGMLFDPHTATQTSKDPLYPAMARDSDIRSALQFTPQGLQRTGRAPTGTFGFKPEAETKLVKSIETTNLSKPELEHRTPIVEVGNTGGAYGMYSSRKNTITFSKDFATNQIESKLINPASSLMHEWGHKVDNDVAISKSPSAAQKGYRERRVESDASAKISKRYLISPIGEGIADGFRERHGTSVEHLSEKPVAVSERFSFFDLKPVPVNERYLDPLQNKFATDGMVGARREGIQRDPNMGYGLNSKHWKTRLEQALYAATRIHVGMHGRQGIESLPDIDSLAKTHLGELANEISVKTNSFIHANYPEKDSRYISTARHLFLGSLVKDQPSVAEGLKHLGFDDIAEHSRKVHDHFDAKSSKNSNQDTLPGLESFSDTNLPPLPKRLTSNQLRRTDNTYKREQEKKQAKKETTPFRPFW